MTASVLLYAKGLRGSEVLASLVDQKVVPRAVFVENNESSTSRIASKSSIPIISLAGIDPQLHLHSVRSFSPDLIVAAGFSKLLPEDILSIPLHGAINCHAGRLPEYRGASPIPWQILNGETSGFCYILKMQKGIDDGGIYFEQEYSIGEHDNATSISKCVNEIFRSAVPRVVKQILAGTAKLVEQKQSNIQVWTRRRAEDGLIDFKQLNASQVVNLVRALTPPYPGAFFWIRENKIVVHKASLTSSAYCGVPGRYIGIREGNPIILARDCGVSIDQYSIIGPEQSCFPPSYGSDIPF